MPPVSCGAAMLNARLPAWSRKTRSQMNSEDVVSLYLLNFEFARAIRDDNVAGSKSIIGRIESQLNRIARDQQSIERR
jgi:hypothetical protein